MVDQPKKESPKPQDQSKVKIKVEGEEREVTQEEAIELAQKGFDYTKKTQELAKSKEELKAREERVAELEGITSEMEDNPKLKEAVLKTYQDVKSGKVSKPEIKKDVKIIDKLLDETSDPATKEDLRRMREIIKEEASGADAKKLEDKIANLEAELSAVKSASAIGLNSRVERQLQELEKDFGKEFLDKYRKDITTMGLKYPKYSAKTILYQLASEDGEFDKALLNLAKEKEKQELERKKRGASPGAEPEVTGKIEIPRDKGGRVMMKPFLEKIIEKKKHLLE